MGRVPETREQSMWQSLNGGVGRSGCVAESHRYRNHADKAGNYGQRPDGAVGAQILLVEHAEMLRHFLVFAHGVSYARACPPPPPPPPPHRQEDGYGLHQHEGSSVTLAE